jgi:stringent starvation protein B
MATPDAPQGSSTRPYLLRALHEWCTDNGFTPYIAVQVDASVQVPTEYVKNNEIVLNVGFEATSALKLGNEFIEFRARFGGVAREIVVPVDHVVAIYARENGQGMAFPMPAATAGAGTNAGTNAGTAGEGPSAGQAPGGPRAARAKPATPAAATKPLRLARQGAVTPVAGVAPARALAASGPPGPAARPTKPAEPGDPADPQPPTTPPGAPRPALKRVK